MTVSQRSNTRFRCIILFKPTSTEETNGTIIPSTTCKSHLSSGPWTSSSLTAFSINQTRAGGQFQAIIFRGCAAVKRGEAALLLQPFSGGHYCKMFHPLQSLIGLVGERCVITRPIACGSYTQLIFHSASRGKYRADFFFKNCGELFSLGRLFFMCLLIQGIVSAHVSK